jgi:hypothetical protein
MNKLIWKYLSGQTLSRFHNECSATTASQAAWPCTHQTSPCHDILNETAESVIFLTLSWSGLWHRVIFRTDTDVSERNTCPIVRVEVCRFRNKLAYVTKLQIKLVWNPKGKGKEMTQIGPTVKSWAKTWHCNVHTALSSQARTVLSLDALLSVYRNETVKKRGTGLLQGHHKFFFRER